MSEVSADLATAISGKEGRFVYSGTIHLVNLRRYSTVLYAMNRIRF